MLFDQISQTKTTLLQLAFDFRRAVQSRSSAIKLVAMTADRIGQTLRYVDCIDRIVVPAFPDHAEGMKVQVVNMLSEAAESFTRMDALIKRAEMYMKQATQSVPVCGPQP